MGMKIRGYENPSCPSPWQVPEGIKTPRSFVEFLFVVVHHCKTPNPKAASFALLRAGVLLAW